MEKNLIDIIAKSGIVGAGGAGFPTHVKMMLRLNMSSLMVLSANLY